MPRIPKEVSYVEGAAELKLVEAIFLEAVRCLLLPPSENGSKIRDAVEWFSRNDEYYTEAVFSFDNVCDFLKLDPTYVRYKLELMSCINLGSHANSHTYGKINTAVVEMPKPKPAVADEDFNWISMYTLGSHLHMSGRREK